MRGISNSEKQSNKVSMVEARISSVMQADRLGKTAGMKGKFAEEEHLPGCCFGPSQNMCRTVTKVERYHRVDRIAMDVCTLMLHSWLFLFRNKER